MNEQEALLTVKENILNRNYNAALSGVDLIYARKFEEHKKSAEDLTDALNDELELSLDILDVKLENSPADLRRLYADVNEAIKNYDVNRVFALYDDFYERAFYMYETEQDAGKKALIGVSLRRACQGEFADRKMLALGGM